MLKELSRRLAKLDGRPYHPEDYLAFMNEAIKKVGEPTLILRINYLETHPAHISGWYSTYNFLLSGRLYDEYSSELVYSE